MPTPMVPELIIALRARRLYLGMNQGDMAKAVGLSRTSITNFERGRQNMSLTQIQHIVQALGLRLEFSLALAHGRSSPKEYLRDEVSRLSAENRNYRLRIRKAAKILGRG